MTKKKTGKKMPPLIDLKVIQQAKYHDVFTISLNQ